jgi:hypothetical protein
MAKTLSSCSSCAYTRYGAIVLLDLKAECSEGRRGPDVAIGLGIEGVPFIRGMV